MFIGKLMQKGVIMAPFCTFSEGKNSLTRKKQSHLFLYRTVNQLFISKSTVNNQLIGYKTSSDSSVFSYLFIPPPFLTFELTLLTFSVPKLY